MSEDEDVINDQLNELWKYAFRECLTNELFYGIFCLDNEVPEDLKRQSYLTKYPLSDVGFKIH